MAETPQTQTRINKFIRLANVDADSHSHFVGFAIAFNDLMALLIREEGPIESLTVTCAAQDNALVIDIKAVAQTATHAPCK